ncbi:FKBP-type peptidyl-prolyl cis-trans isomerase [Dyella caseinilytica]|uniref:Peptidyl-prolyl cis-trans isomerase n=1 Tax=Dyella caseinilytica TaxID=1849581 RepID=A0ABX7GX07_9GAMM|nr:FKBP-type peptidyl-prolyl cis-trans isomerase [Dyella caseinilytica]QRN54947.1 FKBP-type peptidyl-prolyl cis-trans isomerase [Dyella caseinilytica]GFZ98156.1 outer membrane protein MIP [Dyella caseinilytica]
MANTRWLVSGFLLLAASGVLAQQRPAAPNPSPQPPPVTVKLDKYKLSYAIGYHLGTQFSHGTFPVDMAVLQKAMQDAYAKRPAAFSKEEMYQQIASLGELMHEQALAEFNRIADDNARNSAEFLAHNATLSGVVQLPSGIQYSVIKKGDGTVNPGMDSLVTVNYRGMLIDGTEFDSTWAHGSPVSFTLDSVIRGWQYVIPRMHVGDRWKVVIPSSLAYGKQGALPRIGPNQALVFDIELLDIKPPNPEGTGP